MSPTQPHAPTVLFIASECGGIARTGGLGDVVRDLSRALVGRGVPTAVILPAYGSSTLTGESIASLKVPFGGKERKAEVLYLDHDGIPVYQIRNKKFFEKEYGSVYIDSGRAGRGPFEDDAKRFAFFSAAVAAALITLPDFRELTLLHCHDWHSGILPVLLKMDPAFTAVAARLRVLFTIHNLGYQGVRPFVYGRERELNSFASWFPGLYRALAGTPRFFDLRDPLAEFPCFNPIKAGIRLADLVTTVSPTYAHEITLPDDHGNRFIGGHGLERDLTLLARQGRLVGILNGIDYTVSDPAKLDPPFSAALQDPAAGKAVFRKSVLEGLEARLRTLAARPGIPFPGSRRLLDRKPLLDVKLWGKRPLVVFVSRAVDQKAGILFEHVSEGKNLLQKILERELSLVVLASGELSNSFTEYMQAENALFIDTFDGKLATDLYAAGELLLLPSYFEPCGISQLIAMRYGCLPVVHEIGGLHDTVRNRRTGFCYGGVNLAGQQKALLRALDAALKLHREDPAGWSGMMREAMAERFTWTGPTKIYQQLYGQLLGMPVGK